MVRCYHYVLSCCSRRGLSGNVCYSFHHGSILYVQLWYRFTLVLLRHLENGHCYSQICCMPDVLADLSESAEMEFWSTMCDVDVFHIYGVWHSVWTVMGQTYSVLWTGIKFTSVMTGTFTDMESGPEVTRPKTMTWLPRWDQTKDLISKAKDSAIIIIIIILSLFSTWQNASLHTMSCHAGQRW